MPVLEGTQSPHILVANGKGQGPGLGCYVGSVAFMHTIAHIIWKKTEP